MPLMAKKLLCFALLALAPTTLAWAPSSTAVRASLSSLRTQESLCRRPGLRAAHMMAEPGPPASLSRSIVRKWIEVRRRGPLPMGCCVRARPRNTLFVRGDQQDLANSAWVSRFSTLALSKSRETACGFVRARNMCRPSAHAAAGTEIYRCKTR